MEEIGQITANYDFHNIFNVDESGLLFHLGPNRLYLVQEEARSKVRGTIFEKRKKRITTASTKNATFTHKLSIKYIGVAENLQCFTNYPLMRNRYWHQKNGCMDSEGSCNYFAGGTKR